MATYRSLFNHKRGDTFQYAGYVTLPDGLWLGASQVRLPMKIDGAPPVAELAVTITPPTPPETVSGILLYALPDAVETWPLGVLVCDVQFTSDADPNSVLSTETFAFTLVKDVTHDDPT
jgi:hypothetical protein